MDKGFTKGLSIIIAGHANSGKSAMMFHLERLLLENGFAVELSFEGHPDYTGENTYHFHKHEEKNIDKKIEAIKASTKITLKEMQMAREAKHNEKETQTSDND